MKDNVNIFFNSLVLGIVFFITGFLYLFMAIIFNSDYCGYIGSIFLYSAFKGLPLPVFPVLMAAILIVLKLVSIVIKRKNTDDGNNNQSFFAKRNLFFLIKVFIISLIAVNILAPVVNIVSGQELYFEVIGNRHIFPFAVVRRTHSFDERYTAFLTNESWLGFYYSVYIAQKYDITPKEIIHFSGEKAPQFPGTSTKELKISWSRDGQYVACTLCGWHVAGYDIALNKYDKLTSDMCIDDVNKDDWLIFHEKIQNRLERNAK